MGVIRTTLIRMGLATPPLEPHEFEVAMHLLARGPGAGPSVATVPHVVTPMSAGECARCGRMQADGIHRLNAEG